MGSSEAESSFSCIQTPLLHQVFPFCLAGRTFHQQFGVPPSPLVLVADCCFHRLLSINSVVLFTVLVFKLWRLFFFCTEVSSSLIPSTLDEFVFSTCLHTVNSGLPCLNLNIFPKYSHLCKFIVIFSRTRPFFFVLFFTGLTKQSVFIIFITHS